ncbi:GIY-YIG nuclease family protein [Paracoccus sp. 11-3]|uniref:GIY-YIG nuclease family protein n=1 Tax=Paracoccus amoyensis TaxID=2760093 RepID=A0A926GC04_9RHOB|nr:GIY-YIG nuclease family protein [Paracoccus amoyensis]MBC9247191.1 GIY-YIG nuclease family protein [Paracoccus amoyensis]
MRDFILQEIRRVASANGGKAPGRRTFERETGISVHQWRGRFWARWGDALIEAGLSANTKQAKTDSDFLLGKVAEAFRHFKREPTLIELRMYRQLDPELPTHSTLAKHYPAKDDMITALREWTANRDGYDDVAAMLPAATSSPSAPRPLSKPVEGFVYLIKSGDYYKIGRSDDAERRFKQITIALPDKAELFHTIRTDDPSGIEAYWHRRFDGRRANGEWFKLTAADIAAFKKRKFQ